MTIRYDLPAEVEDVLEAHGADVSTLLKEAALLELYRRGILTHYRLGQALGLHRLETDGFLKRWGVPMDLTIEELDEQRRALRPAGER